MITYTGLILEVKKLLSSPGTCKLTPSLGLIFSFIPSAFVHKGLLGSRCTKLTHFFASGFRAFIEFLNRFCDSRPGVPHQMAGWLASPLPVPLGWSPGPSWLALGTLQQETLCRTKWGPPASVLALRWLWSKHPGPSLCHTKCPGKTTGPLSPLLPQNHQINAWGKTPCVNHLGILSRNSSKAFARQPQRVAKEQQKTVPGETSRGSRTSEMKWGWFENLT